MIENKLLKTIVITSSLLFPSLLAPQPITASFNSKEKSEINRIEVYLNGIKLSDPSTPSNDYYFGNLINTDRGQAPCSDGTYGVFGGGYGTINSSGGYQNSIFYVTIATPGNATDFGDRTIVGGYASGAGNATRGLFFGVFINTSPTTSNVIDYVTIASPGNATDFGDLSNPSAFNAAASDATRAVCATGLDSVGNAIRNNIDYVTVANTGNATDFGDLTVAKEDSSACGNGTRIVFNGGSTGSNVNTVEYITVQTFSYDVGPEGSF